MDTFNTSYMLIVFFFLEVILSVLFTTDPKNSANNTLEFFEKLI